MKKSREKELLQLDNAASPNDIERAASILAKKGKSILPKLIDYTRRFPLRFHRREKVMQVIKKMGYPENEIAIPFMLDLAADPNSFGWSLATHVILDIGDPVVPELKKAIYYYLDRSDDFRLALETLYDLIERFDPKVQMHLQTEMKLIKEELEKGV